MISSSALPVIRPITDLRTHMNDVCSQATETQEPIVLTKNGTAAYVLMDSNAYESMVLHNRLVMALREAEIEEKYHPETLSKEESDTRMKEIFEQMGVDYRPQQTR